MERKDSQLIAHAQCYNHPVAKAINGPGLEQGGELTPDPMMPEDIQSAILGGPMEGYGDADVHHDFLGSAWFDYFVADLPRHELQPFDAELPVDVIGRDPVTGEMPTALFTAVALPRLRTAFPYYYEKQRQRCLRMGVAIESSPEEAFESEARMLRLMVDSGAGAVNRARKLQGVAVMTLDNDITMSWKYDTENAGDSALYSGEAWDAMTEGEQRSAYERLSDRDLMATVIRPAVIVGAATLKEEYGDELLLGVLSSNTQSYLNNYAVVLNREVQAYVRMNGRTNARHFDEAFSSEHMTSYTDGRYRDILHAERELTRAKKGFSREQSKVSPTLLEMFWPGYSEVYRDADLFIDFDSDEALSISAQDLKLAALLHMREEPAGDKSAIQVERVHLDDMPSSMTKKGPRLRYETLSEKARFFAIEVEKWERGLVL